MKHSSLRAWLNTHESVAIVITALAVVTSLVSVELVTGLPASIRGTPVYNTLPMPIVKRTMRLHPAARPSAAARRAELRRLKHAQQSSQSSSLAR